MKVFQSTNFPSNGQKHAAFSDLFHIRERALLLKIMQGKFWQDFSSNKPDFSLPSIEKKEYLNEKQQEMKSESDFPTVPIVAAVVSLVFVLITIAIVVVWRRRLSTKQRNNGSGGGVMQSLSGRLNIYRSELLLKRFWLSVSFSVWKNIDIDL